MTVGFLDWPLEGGSCSQTGRLDGVGVDQRGLEVQLEGCPSRSGCCNRNTTAQAVKHQKLIPPDAGG